MDLNYLFLRQQVERSLANAAKNDAAREAHEKLAKVYESAIEQESEGRIVFPWNHEPAPVSVSRTQSASS